MSIGAASDTGIELVNLVAGEPMKPRWRGRVRCLARIDGSAMQMSPIKDRDDWLQSCTQLAFQSAHSELYCCAQDSAITAPYIRSSQSLSAPRHESGVTNRRDKGDESINHDYF